MSGLTANVEAATAAAVAADGGLTSDLQKRQTLSVDPYCGTLLAKTGSSEGAVSAAAAADHALNAVATTTRDPVSS